MNARIHKILNLGAFYMLTAFFIFLAVHTTIVAAQTNPTSQTQPSQIEENTSTKIQSQQNADASIIQARVINSSYTPKVAWFDRTFLNSAQRMASLYTTLEILIAFCLGLLLVIKYKKIQFSRAVIGFILILCLVGIYLLSQHLFGASVLFH